ncbi:MAG: hypothetical protein ABF572_04705 [Gluconobacter sp.]|uniref:hypothetical protein n=1 Tax=Gluconobacter sp. TaxID=1876758 RepID=UPI0039EAB16F
MKWPRFFKKENKGSFQLTISSSDMENIPAYLAISPDSRWTLDIVHEKSASNYILLHDNERVFSYPVDVFGIIINDFRLSNSGNFCFSQNNSLKDDKALATSTLYLVSAGQVRRITLSGFFRTCAISDDGKLCAIKGSTVDHKREVALLSIESGEQIASFMTDDYKLNDIQKILPEQKKIILSDQELGAFSFSFSGKIDDEKSYIDAELHRGNLNIVCARVDKILKFKPTITDTDLLEELLVCIDSAHPARFSEDKWNKKSALSTKIAIFERLKRLTEAHQCASELAEFFPTVTNKKKAASLKKRINL